MRFTDEFKFTAFTADVAVFDPTVDMIVAEHSEPETAAGPVIPVEDEDGGLWLCRETDNSCECIPW